MGDEINTITIVGGGDSGLLTGLCIEQLNPDVDISIVDDFQRDVPQVGKSTYKRILDFLHNTLDIDEDRFIAEVKPVWKGTVYFRDWCGYPSFHFPFDDQTKFPTINTPNASEAYYYHYDELYDSPEHRTTGEEIAAQGKSPMYFVPERWTYQKYNEVAYHLDTERFNSFLRKLCRERGISLINDEVTGVETTGNRVERIRSKSQSYESDLYIDASGFNRVIKGEMDSGFVEFDFPLDSAVHASIDRSLSEIVPATVIDSGENGWFWQIDTYDNRDLGYVFASDFVSDGEATTEFLEHCDGAVSEDDVTQYEFTSGYYEHPWEGNCIAIGNAEGFVEPLQSTGLTANAEAAVVLSNLLASRHRINDAGIRDTYNSWVERSWKSIYDFISIHYKYSAGENEFWQAMQSIPISSRVETLVREFDRNGFDTVVNPMENDADVEELLIFHPVNFYVILRNMGGTSEFYETNQFHVSDAVRRERDEYYEEITDDVNSYITVQELYESVLEEADIA